MLIIILFITKNLFIYLNSKVIYINNKHCETFLVLLVHENNLQTKMKTNIPMWFEYIYVFDMTYVDS